MNKKYIPYKFDGYTYMFCMTFPINHFNFISTRMDFYIDNKYQQIHSIFSGSFGLPNRNTFLENYVKDEGITFSTEDLKEANKYLMTQELMR